MNISTVYGHSCGLFLCITAAHLVSDAKLPDIQANIKVTVHCGAVTLVRPLVRPACWRDLVCKHGIGLHMRHVCSCLVWCLLRGEGVGVLGHRGNVGHVFAEKIHSWCTSGVQMVYTMVYTRRFCARGATQTC